MSNTIKTPCRVCLIGYLHEGRATYICTYDDKPIVVPDTQAYICDVCGFTRFDEKALQRIQLLTGTGDFQETIPEHDGKNSRIKPHSVEIDRPTTIDSQQSEP